MVGNGGSEMQNYCKTCFAPLSEDCGCKAYEEWWDSLTPEEQRLEHELADDYANGYYRERC